MQKVTFTMRAVKRRWDCPFFISYQHVLTQQVKGPTRTTFYKFFWYSDQQIWDHNLILQLSLSTSSLTCLPQQQTHICYNVSPKENRDCINLGITWLQIIMDIFRCAVTVCADLVQRRIETENLLWSQRCLVKQFMKHFSLSWSELTWCLWNGKKGLITWDTKWKKGSQVCSIFKLPAKFTFRWTSSLFNSSFSPAILL